MNSLKRLFKEFFDDIDHFYSDQIINSLMGCPYQIETSPLICTTNLWTGFYMTGIFVMKELIL